MPVTVGAKLRRLTQDEFGDLAYRVMGHVFDIHRELGRFFDEDVYLAELASRCGNAVVEMPVELAFDGFRKTYSCDLLVDGGGLFELKTVDSLHERHRAQVTNYLLLAELAHAKLINLRPETVEHEFVNTSLSLADRTSFQVNDRDWSVHEQKTVELKCWLTALLRDVGVGLAVEIYDEASIYFLGGEEVAMKEVSVLSGALGLGGQKLICPTADSVLRITGLPQRSVAAYAEHLERFLLHLHVERLHWINVGRSSVVFRTLARTDLAEKWGAEK